MTPANTQTATKSAAAPVKADRTGKLADPAPEATTAREKRYAAYLLLMGGGAPE